MNEWLKTERGEFKKSKIKGIRLDCLVLPMPNISQYVMTIDYNQFWRVEVMIDGAWTGATDYVKDKNEAQERLNNIMQEIKGDKNNE